MKNTFFAALGVIAAVFAGGCVEVSEEVYMNHDGSGKMVEKIALSPRGQRMWEGLKKRSGKGGEIPYVLSEEAQQARLKNMGEVTVVSKEPVATLPDGRKQISTTYSFKDIGKVTFWVVPTLSYRKAAQSGPLDGKLRLVYRPQYVRFGSLLREEVSIKTVGSDLPPQQPLTPAERENFRRVVPIFLEMIRDIHVSIVVIAPIEDFEVPRDMLWNLSADHNRVTVYNVDGRGVMQASDFMQQLAMNEVMGADRSGIMRRTIDSIPGCFTPYPAESGYFMRFMKSIPAPEGSPSEN